MAIYNPIETPEQTEQWINWLENVAKDLNGMEPNGEPSREILNTEEGDLHEFKNMVGNFLATLKKQIVIIQ
jgi:hypothetical protein